MKVLVTAALLILSAAAVFSAPTAKCRVCEQPIPGEFYFVKDKARGGKFEVCTNCVNLTTRCFSCSLPVKTGFTTLADGRLLCTYCAKEAVTQDEEARTICWEAQDTLDRLFARFLTFPRTNISVTIVDRFTLDSLFKSPGYAQQCTSVFGATRTHPFGEGRYIHAVSVLSGLSKPRLEAVAAHEFSHAWLNENLTAARKAALSREALEGFCELIAYDLMQERSYEVEKTSIKENPYTAGQLEAFVTAETTHGFNAVLDWIKAGEAAKLDAADPDGVRAVREEELSRASTTAASGSLPVYYSYATPPPLPDKLTLKNISGTPARRLAIINDRTFGVKDLALMKLANTNVIVRCVEIRTNSVLIQFDETGEKQELFLPEE
jgi:hypothetical protein